MVLPTYVKVKLRPLIPHAASELCFKPWNMCPKPPFRYQACYFCWHSTVKASVQDNNYMKSNTLYVSNKQKRKDTKRYVHGILAFMGS